MFESSATRKHLFLQFNEDYDYKSILNQKCQSYGVNLVYDTQLVVPVAVKATMGYSNISALSSDYTQYFLPKSSDSSHGGLFASLNLKLDDFNGGIASTLMPSSPMFRSTVKVKDELITGEVHKSKKLAEKHVAYEILQRLEKNTLSLERKRITVDESEDFVTKLSSPPNPTTFRTWKSILYEYCQKKRIDSPLYTTYPYGDHFKCKLEINSIITESIPFSNKRAAENDASEKMAILLGCANNKPIDAFLDKSDARSPVVMNTSPNWKGKLLEIIHASRGRITKPIYEHSQTPIPSKGPLRDMFQCTLRFAVDGQEETFVSVYCRSKKQSDQDASQKAIEFVESLQRSEHGLNSSIASSVAALCIDNDFLLTSDDKLYNSVKSVMPPTGQTSSTQENYKGMFLQLTQRKDRVTSFSGYSTLPSDNGFVSSLSFTALDKTIFVSSSVFATKKAAEQDASRRALVEYDLLVSRF